MFVPYPTLMAARLFHSRDLDGLAEALTDPSDEPDPDPGAPKAQRHPQTPQVTTADARLSHAA